MEEERKNTQKNVVMHSKNFQDDLLSIESQEEHVNVREDPTPDEERTPKIIKKLHRRQISSASAKMFALNDEMFPGVNNDLEKYSEDLPKWNIEQTGNETSKGVRFEKNKSDDGVSRSILRSDIEGTLDTQLTTVSNQHSTVAGTLGTSSSSNGKDDTKQNRHAPLQGMCIASENKSGIPRP